jgi:hypothetical protein
MFQEPSMDSSNCFQKKISEFRKKKLLKITLRLNFLKNQSYIFLIGPNSTYHMQPTLFASVLLLLLIISVSEAGQCYSVTTAYTILEEDDSESFEQDYGHLLTFSLQCAQACADKIGVMVSPNGVLTNGQIMRKHNHIASPNQKYFLIFQQDGNLVAYEGPRTSCTCQNFNGQAVAYWATNTVGIGAQGQQCEAIFQMDGNFVIYCGKQVHFATNTEHSGANRFQIQDDGNIVMYKDNQVVWSSNTVRS